MKLTKNRIISALLATVILIASVTVPVFVGAETSSDYLSKIEETARNAALSLVFKNDTSDDDIISAISDELGSDYTVKKIGDFYKDAAVHGAIVTLDGKEIATTRIADGAISGTVMIADNDGVETSMSFSGIIKAEMQKTFAYTSEELVPNSDITTSGSNIIGAITDGKKLLIIDGAELGATVVNEDAFATGTATKLATTIETIIFRNVSYTANLIRFSEAKVVILDSGVTQPIDKKPYSNQLHHNFAKLAKLEYISLCEGIRYLGFADFGATTGSFGVVVPDSVIQFGGWAFSGASGLYGIKIPAQTTSTSFFMEGGVFNQCTSLISIRLPEGMTTLANENFNKNEKLETVVLPSTLTSITGASNFNNCFALEVLELPSKLTTISQALASNYKNVNFRIVVTGNLLNDAAVNKIKACSSAGKSVICFGGTKTADSVTNYIDIAEFYNGLGNSKLSSQYSSSGNSVTISILMDSGYDLPKLGINFAYKDAMGKRMVPAADTNDEKTEYTYSLDKISNGIEIKAVKVYSESEADVYANLAQTALDNLAVDRETTADDLINSVNAAIDDENVNFVWIDPFKKITPVDSADIYLDGELIASTDKQDGGIYATIGIIVGEHTRLVLFERELAATTERFSYTSKDKAPDSAFTVENGVLTGYEGSYKLIVVPDSVSRININSPLSGNKHAALNHGECKCIESIEAVIISNRVTYLDWVTFSKEVNLKVAVINSSANLSGMNFYHCDSLKYVKLSDSIATIGQETFRYCASLKAIELPLQLKTLGESALRDSGIKDVTLPDTVTTIGSNATKDITVYGKGEDPKFADTIEKAKEYFANIPVSLETEEMLSEAITKLAAGFETKVTSFKRTESNLTATADIIVVKDNRKFVYSVSCDRLIPTHNLDEIVRKIQNSVKSMKITNDTTKEDLTARITAAVDDARVEIVYVQEFDKVRAINGANVYLSGKLVGSVPTIDGRITAILGVKFKGEKATVVIDERITPTIENYNYNSKAPDSDFTIEDKTLKKYNGSSELVIIPDSVTKINASALSKNQNTKVAIIPDTVTIIDWTTFYNCTNLEVVIVSEKVSKLPGMNFRECSSLRYVKLPSGLKRIGEECFLRTENLETLQIPKTLVYVDRRAFCDSGIYELTLPESLEVIYEQAFRAQAGSVKHLDKIIILSDTVKYNAGKNIEEPKEDSVVLPIFGYGHEVKLFCRANSTTANLYNSMNFTESNEGLTLCKYIDQTYLDAIYAAKSIVSNMYSDTETAKLLKSFIEKKITNKNVSVEIVSFQYDKVNIYATADILTKVNDEEWAVRLSGEKKVLISGYDQLIKAAQNALNTMTITDETTKEDIEANVEIAIDSGTAIIKWSSDFAKRKSVHGAVIKVKDQSWDIAGIDGKIAGYINITFKGKNEDIKLERTISPEIEILKYKTVSNETEFTIVNDKVFSYDGNSEVVVLPKAQTITTTCLRMKPGIKAIIVPEGMTVIQSQAFQEMPDLEAVYFSDSCTNLGISANRPDNEGAALFAKCANLKYVRLSPYTTEIPFYTFSKCTSLTEFYIPEGITKIGHRAFWVVSESLEDLVLPSTLTKIGSYAFAGNNATGTAAFDDIIILSNDLKFFVESEEHPNAGPFACYSNKVVNIHYPKGANPNYLDSRLGRYNFKINTYEEEQTLSQAAIDLQRLLNDYPITNDTTKEVMNAAINKLITNNQIKYKWTKDYNKVNCSFKESGRATGQILLTDSNTNLTFIVKLNKSISPSTFVDNRTISIFDAATSASDNWDDEPQSNNQGNGISDVIIFVIIGIGATLLLTGATIATIIFLKKRKIKNN